MRNFFHFLLQHSNFLFMLLLEAICAVLVFNFNDYHRASYLSSSNAVMGTFYSITGSVSHYFGLADANEDLARQNVQLMAKVDSLTRILDARQDSLLRAADSIHAVAGSADPEILYRVGHVIRTMSNRSRNMLTLDVGEAEGVRQDMAVANAEGVVGLVSAVSRHFSLVLPVINTSSRLSVKIKGSQHRGQLVWDGVSAARAEMIDVPEHATVSVGDTIVTSGASCYFPEGLVVGTVEKVNTDRNGGFFRLNVSLAVDFNAVYTVEIIDDTRLQERIDLESSVSDE